VPVAPTQILRNCAILVAALWAIARWRRQVLASSDGLLAGLVVVGLAYSGTQLRTAW
jgi:hypothetical protein